MADITYLPPGYIWDGHGNAIPAPTGYVPPATGPFAPGASDGGLPPADPPTTADSPSGPATGTPGWTPPDGAIPITNGMPSPGPGYTPDWTHGYFIPIPGYVAPAAPAPSPTPAPGGGGGGTGGGGGGGSASTGTADFPTFTAPDFTPAQPLPAPPAFDYAPWTPPSNFTAPTLAEAQAQPGYQFGLQQGQDALQNAAAARGTLRGGGTLKDLFNYTNAAAEQNYGNVFNQNLTTYGTNLAKDYNAYTTNLGAAQDAYKTNWGVTKDVYTLGNAANQQNYMNAFQNAAAQFNPQFQASTLSFEDTYNRWLANLNAQLHIYDQGAT